MRKVSSEREWDALYDRPTEQSQGVRVLLFLFMILMLAAQIAGCVLFGVGDRPAVQIMSICIDTLIEVLMILMFYSNLHKKSITDFTATFLKMLFVNTVFAFLDCFSPFVEGIVPLRQANVAIHAGYHLCAIALAYLFWNLLWEWVAPKFRRINIFTQIIRIFAAISVALVVGNLWFRYFYSVTPEGLFVRGERYYLCTILPGIMLLFGVILVLSRKMKFREKLVFLTFPLVPFVGVFIADRFLGRSMISALTFLSLFMIYVDLYTRHEKELLDQHEKLIEARSNAMLQQINPHFIYNALGSIAGLCSADPEKAKDVLHTFSGYLRNNFSEMASQSMIPFSKELEHLRSYLEIEKLRFPDIEIVWDLQFTDFELPSLSVQPLVENAITHGIMGKEDGGRVNISSYLEGPCCVVRVEDDGIGFDPAKPKKDGRKHIGIENVRTRLKMICDGELRITSRPGIGTVAEIRIPLKG